MNDPESSASAGDQNAVGHSYDVIDPDAVLHAERAGRALRALKRMPPPLRRVFMLRVIDEREEVFICAKLGISIGRYRARLARAFAYMAQASRSGI